jgi:hypothetical protein
MIGSFAADAEMRMHVEPKVLRLLVYSSIYMNCAYSASLAVWRRSHGQISTEKRILRQVRIASAKPTNEMVRRCHPPLRRRILAAVSEEDHRHADSFGRH